MSQLATGSDDNLGEGTLLESCHLSARRGCLLLPMEDKELPNSQRSSFPKTRFCQTFWDRNFPRLSSSWNRPSEGSVSKPGLEGFSATSLCSWNSISQVIPLGINCHHSLCPLLLAQLKILNSCKSHPYILLLFAPCVSRTADLTCFLLSYWLVPFCVPLFFDDTESRYVTLASLEF